MHSKKPLFLYLAIFSLIFNLSCADKNDEPPKTETTKEQNPLPQSTPDNSSEDKPVDQPSPQPLPTPPKTSTKDYSEAVIDPYVATYITEIREYISQNTASSASNIQNLEFANRIFKVNFKYGKRSQLTLTTHTAKAFYFEHVRTKNNIQFFTAYDNQVKLLGKSSTALYSAKAKINKDKNKTVAVIQIKDNLTDAIVHVLYVKKIGTVDTIFVSGPDYSRDLTKTSKIFLQRIMEDSSVEAEFYHILTKEKNISNATRFRLVVSDNFTMTSQPLTGHFREDQPNVIPLMVDYKSFWKMFFFGSTAYKVIKDVSYLIEANRSPVELAAFNLDLKIEGKEKIKGQTNTLPIKFHIRFK